MTGHQTLKSQDSENPNVIVYAALGQNLSRGEMGKMQYVFNKKMGLTLIIIYIFFIIVTGQTAQTAFANDILYDDINSLYGWYNPELFDNDCRSTQQTAIDSHSVTANGYLFNDCLFNTQPETALLTYDHGGIKRLDYLTINGPNLQIRVTTPSMPGLKYLR